MTTHNGLLTLTAEREAKETGASSEGGSEFYYGTFSRTVSLPAGADPAKVKATYSDGILEITMPVSESPRTRWPRGGGHQLGRWLAVDRARLDLDRRVDAQAATWSSSE